MSWDEVMQKAKNAIKAKDASVDVDKLEQVYSSRMMELQRILLQYTEYDCLYSVTVDLLNDTVTVKTYVAQK